MKSKIVIPIIVATMSLVLFSNCTDVNAQKNKNNSQIQKQEEFEGMGSQYEALLFNKNESELSEYNKRIIRKLIEKSDREKSPISVIKLLAWSDKEYPDEKDNLLSPQDEELAAARGENTKLFIQDELNRSDTVKVFNMAERPNFFAELAKNDEYETKEAFEESGPTSTILPNGDISYSKASKVIVIIDYNYEY